MLLDLMLQMSEAIKILDLEIWNVFFTNKKHTQTQMHNHMYNMKLMSIIGTKT